MALRGTPKGGRGLVIRHMQTQTHTEGETHIHSRAPREAKTESKAKHIQVG